MNKNHNINQNESPIHCISIPSSVTEDKSSSGYASIVSLWNFGLSPSAPRVVSDSPMGSSPELEFDPSPPPSPPPPPPPPPPPTSANSTIVVTLSPAPPPPPPEQSGPSVTVQLPSLPASNQNTNVWMSRLRPRVNHGIRRSLNEDEMYPPMMNQTWNQAKIVGNSMKSVINLYCNKVFINQTQQNMWLDKMKLTKLNENTAENWLLSGDLGENIGNIMYCDIPSHIYDLIDDNDDEEKH